MNKIPFSTVIYTMKLIKRILSLVLILFSFSTYAQRESPLKIEKGSINGVEIKLTYSSPFAKGRKIFGGLVPYNEMWRTGANRATTLEIEEGIIIGGKKLEAGKYEVFTIPTKEEWTIIIHEYQDQCGMALYREENDVMRFKVQSKTSQRFHESMSFSIVSNAILLEWENTQVTIPVGYDDLVSH